MNDKHPPRRTYQLALANLMLALVPLALVFVGLGISTEGSASLVRSTVLVLGICMAAATMQHGIHCMLFGFVFVCWLLAILLVFGFMRIPVI